MLTPIEEIMGLVVALIIWMAALLCSWGAYCVYLSLRRRLLMRRALQIRAGVRALNGSLGVRQWKILKAV